MEEDIILPDGFTSETAQPQAEETVQETTPEVANSEVSPEITMENPKFKVKYNHEEKELGYDEAVPLIQKGMNYDKLQEKFNEIQSDPRLSKYERVAQVSQLLGYQSDDELLDALYNTYYESTAQNQGLTPEQIRKEYELRQKEDSLKQKELSAKEQEQKTKMYEKLISKFPDINPTDIKPETWLKVNSGEMDLLAAYIEQRNNELETRVKILEQNEKNSKKALVTGATTHGTTTVASQDPFLMGFDSIK